MARAVEVISFRLEWVLIVQGLEPELWSKLSIRGVPLSAADEEISGLEVSTSIDLVTENRRTKLHASLRRMHDALSTEYGQRTVRFRGEDMAETAILKEFEGSMHAISMRFEGPAATASSERRTVVVTADLRDDLKRLFTSINLMVLSIVENLFETNFGRSYVAGEQRDNVKKASHKVFLSHNRKDKEIALRLAGDLDKQGIDVWFDEWEIMAGDSVVGKIEEGLATSTVFVMLLSTAFNDSQWCTEEYRSAVSQAVHSGRPRLIPVLREECDVPALVADKRRIDLRQDDFYDTAVEELLNAIYGISPRPSR